MELQSARLHYTKFTSSDKNHYCELVSNAAVMHYITGKALSLEESEKKFAQLLINNNKWVNLGVLLVRNRIGNTFMGLCKLTFISADTAEIGYCLLPPYWGKRYATEIVACLLEHAKNQLSLRRIIAIIDPKNIASERLLLRYNFRLYKVGFWEQLPASYYELLLH